ncbi:MAG: hypothetical protein KBG48_06930 [Kofleriaceae bacterium]|nr:hypothetical protein [Kofleriaceae bacterium]MBP9167102.1 hypothetical protein [Kofleriaceae bacterium]MBP9863089.1 hypothetical protein [Kofleriaceae bacterium]
MSSRPAPTSAPLLLRMLEERHHRDADDRPLCEVRTPPEHLRPGDLIHRACPYPGSRHGRPMNVAALAQMSSHWDDVVDALAVLRTRYAAARPEAAPELLDVWRVSQFAASLPWFFLLRRDQPIPGFAAALAKATQGVGLWAQRILVERLAGGPAPAMTAAAIAASAEATGLLVGEVEACAGSEAMIRRFLEALLTGRPRAEGPAVAALAAAGDEVERFAAHYTNLKLVWWLLALARRFVYADLAAAVPAGHPLGAALVELRDGPGDPPDFFLVGPADPAAVARPVRGAWLTGLAGLVEPLAPDGSDRVLGAVARAVAGAVGAEEPPAATLTDEAAITVGPDAAPAVAQALATYVHLDRLLGLAATAVEAGLRGDGTEVHFPPALRDRLIAAPARAVVTQLAPRTIAALTA